MGVSTNGSITGLIEEAKSDGVEFSADGGQLLIGVPKSKSHWRKKLDPHRADILRHLKGDPEPPPPEPKRQTVEPYAPFPVDSLPGPIARYVKAAATAIGCDTAFVALPCLAACAGAVGNSRRVMLKRGWYEPAVLWAAVVGESGTQKSPAQDASIAPLERWQSDEFEQYAERMAQYDIDRQRYEQDKKKWKGVGDPPEKPEPPACVRYIVSDTTVEGLVPILQENPRGVLLARDELAGWFGSFDKYSAGKSGTDSANWLSMYGARSVTVDRKTGDKRTLYVPRAAVSVCGTIQPAILNRALGTEHRESGLAARLLLACPPRTPKRWSDREIPEAVECEYSDVLDRLLALEMETDDDGRTQPGLVRLSAEARELFVAFVNRHGEESTELSGDLAAAYSKLEGAAARLALVFALVSGETEIAGATMASAIDVVEWLKRETTRIYGLFVELDTDRENRELVEWIERKGGEVTARQVQQGHRKYRTSDDAEAALDALVKAELGAWEVLRTATNQKRVFRLRMASTSTHSSKSPETSESVDVDSVVASETATEWEVA